MANLSVVENCSERQYDASVGGITRSITEICANREDNANQQVRGQRISSTRPRSTRGRSNRPLISERKRENLANLCCGCGILGAATGGGLILIYLLSEYTSLFGDYVNLQVVSVPGLTFLLLGVISSFAGIFLCWIYPKRRTRSVSSRSRRCRSNIDDELDAGFHLPGYPMTGYCNQAMTHDLPPSYVTITSSEGGTVQTIDTLQRPPSYVDAIKVKTQTKSVSEDPPLRREDAQPPPYNDDDTFL